MKKSVCVFLVMAVSMAAYAQDKLVLDGSTTVGPIAKAFAEMTMRENPDVTILVSESGSGNGAKALLNGTCDIANLSRHLKPSEQDAMAEKGVKPVAHVVAYDGLPVIVHPSNKVKGLTIRQVRAIYTGEVTNWKEVGGYDQPILVISRDTNSGTYETFKEMVLDKGDKIIGNAEYTGSNGGVRQRVQTTTGAIGYAGLGFVDATVKALEINGVAPSAETVVDTRTYPISRELFMYTNGDPAPGSLAAKFLALCLTEKGREVIEEIGYVPVPATKQ